MKKRTRSLASSRSGLGWVALLCCLSIGCGEEPAGPPEHEVRILIATPAVRGTISIRVEAPGADAVELFASSTRIGSDPAEPFVLDWDTKPFPNGPIALKAVARWRSTVRSAETSVDVANPVHNSGLFLHPAEARLQLGQSLTFTGIAHDVPNPSVRWEVAGGPERGKVDAFGRYTAPIVLPNPPEVLLRATSLWDAERVAEAVILLEPPPIPIEMARRCRIAFFGPRAGEVNAEAAISEAAGWIAAATALHGERTTTGTLVEEASGSRTYRYSPAPADRMIVQLVGADGPLEYQLLDVELIATTISAEVLARSHELFRFELRRFDGSRAIINSVSRFQIGSDGTEQTDFVRTCSTFQSIGPDAIRCAFNSTGREVRVVNPERVRTITTRRNSGELSGILGNGAYAQQSSRTETVEPSTGETDREETQQLDAEFADGVDGLRWAEVELFSHARQGRVATPERWLARGTLTSGDRAVGTLDYQPAPLEGARLPGYGVSLKDGGRLPL